MRAGLILFANGKNILIIEDKVKDKKFGFFL